MDEREASWLAEDWSGARGLVPRGPKWLLGWSPADAGDVERHTGHRPQSGSEVWRVDVGGRFLRSGTVVYPGGVPYPHEFVGRTATVSSEVWLYVDARTSRVLGTHSWPEAIRRPVAARPAADFAPDIVLRPDDAADRLEFRLPVPRHPKWRPELVVCPSSADAIVLLAAALVPDPVNEMVLFEQGGISLRVAAGPRPDYAEILRVHQPPFRRLRTRTVDAVAREPGRALGPQTWPWPGELMWWRDGLGYALKGFFAVEMLEEVARTVS